MITFKIKSWECPSCGYMQDFEPTQELMIKHHKMTDDTCPSCLSDKLIRATNSKMVMNSFEEDDITKHKTDLEAGANKEVNGKIETNKEKKERIDKVIAKMKPLKLSEVQILRDKYEDK